VSLRARQMLNLEGKISLVLTTFAPLSFPLCNRSTVLGAAILAGGALGLFNWDLTKPETLAKVNRLDVKVFSPTIDEQEREWKYSGWTRAVDRARGWKSELSGSCPYICHRDRLADAFPLSSQPTPVMAKATIRNENAGRPISSISLLPPRFPTLYRIQTLFCMTFLHPPWLKACSHCMPSDLFRRETSQSQARFDGSPLFSLYHFVP
jgi:hypothetical protein